MSPKVGSEDPAPTPQPVAQLRRDPPVRHAVESGAVQHEKVLFYAAEGGQRGHRGERRGLRVSLTQARRAGELSIVALRGHPPVRRPHPPPLAARTERGPSSIDRAPASSPPREPSLPSRDGAERGKSEDWREKTSCGSVARRSKSGVRSVDREGRQLEENVWINSGPGTSRLVPVVHSVGFFFLARQAHTPGRPDAADSSGGGGGLGLNKGAIW